MHIYAPTNHTIEGDMIHPRFYQSADDICPDFRA